MPLDPRECIIGLFHTAVAAADPAILLPAYLDKFFLANDFNKSLNKADLNNVAGEACGKVIVIGAGKVAAAMAASLEQHWGDEVPITGLVVTAYGHSVPCERIDVVEAAHPVPDHNSELAAQRILDIVADVNEHDLVICLLSGGGSSLLALPAPGIRLEDKQQISQALLKSGADIHEINCVRKHLSAIKGGRLAVACAPAKLMTFAISDVPGDDPSVIASGPTLSDATTRQQALAVLDKYQIAVGDNVRQWLESDQSETPKKMSQNLGFEVIATAQQSLEAAAVQAENLGFETLILGDDFTGESGQLAQSHGKIIRQIIEQGTPISRPCVLLSGGETTVKVRGNGRGGRNTQYLLALAIALKGQGNVYALAADTDGIDGSGDNAGAVLTPSSWERSEKMQLKAEKFMENNDSYAYFEALDDLLITGPTRTNVNDFRAILVLPES